MVCSRRGLVSVGVGPHIGMTCLKEVFKVISSMVYDSILITDPVPIIILKKLIILVRLLFKTLMWKNLVVASP